jgi:hypothetical protein
MPKRTGRDIRAGIDWKPEEMQRLRGLYKNNTTSSQEKADILNKEFWKGGTIRTVRSTEHAAYRNKFSKPKAIYAKGILTPYHKQIWRLHQQGVSYERMSEITGRKVGSIKSALNYMRQHSMLAEVAMQNAEMSTRPDPKSVRTKEELIKNIKALSDQLTKAKAINEIIVDTVKASVDALPKMKVPDVIIKKGQHRPEVAMLDFGDVHVGERVVKEDVANMTEYSFDKFLERMDVLRDSIAECIDIQRSRIPINTLVINMLGDIVTGEDIYLGQNRNIDMELTKQTFEGAHYISEKLITPMAKLFNKVRIHAVFGNHGRTGKPGQFHPRTNFDYIVYRFLYEHYRNQPNVEINIAECPLMLFKLPEAPNYNHLLCHGDTVNSWMSVPYYGIQRDAGKYVQLFNMPLHYIHIGHFHNSAKIDMPYGEQIVNGSFCGGSELSIFKMKTKSRPKQLLFGFNDTRGKTWSYDIQLTGMDVPVRDSRGFYTPTYKGRK